MEHTLDYFDYLQQGDEEGFNYFFHLYYKPLTHFAYSILGSNEIMEDIVEDSFLKLWQNREKLTSLSSVKPFLYATVKNACIDILRKQQHKSAYKTHLQKSPVEFVHDITKSIIIVETMHQVYSAVQNLPSKYRQIFNMLWVQGKEVKEIAKELNLPLSTVKSQKARTLELIRTQLLHISCLTFIFISGTI